MLLSPTFKTSGARGPAATTNSPFRARTYGHQQFREIRKNGTSMGGIQTNDPEPLLVKGQNTQICDGTHAGIVRF